MPLNDDDLARLLALDRRYLDSSLTEGKVRRHHLRERPRNTTIHYFRDRSRKIVGYIEYGTRRALGRHLEEEAQSALRASDVYVVWVVAPRRGRRAMHWMAREAAGKRIGLHVSIDRNEGGEASRARLNLYFSVGYTVRHVSWGNGGRVSLLLVRDSS